MSIELQSRETFTKDLLSFVDDYNAGSDEGSKHKILLDISENLLKTFCGILFGEYKKNEVLDESMERVLYRCSRNLSFGNFQEFFRTGFKLDSGKLPVINTIYNIQCDSFGKLVKDYDVIKKYVNQGNDSEFETHFTSLGKGISYGKKSIVDVYNTIIEVRNIYAHPEDKAKNPVRRFPTGEEYFGYINARFEKVLECILNEEQFFKTYLLFFVEDSDIEDDKLIVNIKPLQKKVKSIKPLKLPASYDDLIESEETYVFTKNELMFKIFQRPPMVNKEVAERIIKEEKQKNGKELLKTKVERFLSDNVIDKIEYFSLKDDAEANYLTEEDVLQAIEFVQKKLGIEGNVLVDESEVEDLPVLNPMWLIHLQSISDYSVEKGKTDDLTTRTGMHKYVWDDATRYFQYLMDEHFNENWEVTPNKWQVGKLTGYYWARIYPKNAPLYTVNHIAIKMQQNGLIVQLETDWQRAEVFEESIRDERYNLWSEKMNRLLEKGEQISSIFTHYKGWIDGENVNPSIFKHVFDEKTSVQYYNSLKDIEKKPNSLMLYIPYQEIVENKSQVVKKILATIDFSVNVIESMNEWAQLNGVDYFEAEQKLKKKHKREKEREKKKEQRKYERNYAKINELVASEIESKGKLDEESMTQIEKLKMKYQFKESDIEKIIKEHN